MNKVRIGVIGAGFWAISNHIRLLAERNDVELTAVCRLGEEQLKALQQEFGFKFATENAYELLKQPLDGVIIASPNTLHFEHARAALEARIHVMVEKPMTLDPSDAWKLVKLAEQNNRHLLVPLGWNYKPFVRKAYEMIKRGAIGEIRHVSCLMGSPTLGLFEGTGDYGSTQINEFEIKAAPTTWASVENGGGYANGQLVHATSLLTWVTGLRAKSVYGQWLQGNSGVDLYNTATVKFDGGAIGVISGTGSLPEQCGFQVDLRVTGTEGVLLLDVERERCELRRHDGRDEVVSVEPASGAYECNVPPNRFIELIKGQPVTNDSSGEISARAIEIISALRLSAKSGREELVTSEQ